MIAVQLFLTMFAGILTLSFWLAGDEYGVVTVADKSVTNVCQRFWRALQSQLAWQAIGWFIIASSLAVAVLTCYFIVRDSMKSLVIAKAHQHKCVSRVF